MSLNLRNPSIFGLVAILAFVSVSATFAKGYETRTHRFEEVAPDVYFANAAGPVFLMSNALVVVNEDDALVVDSHVSPLAGSALLESIKTISDKPVKTSINSHDHYDHAHGNQAFGEDVLVIGHEYTREICGDLLTGGT